MTQINLRISDQGLTPKQREVLNCPSRFVLWRAGRRGAKSLFAIYRQGKFAVKNPKTVNWYVAQDTSLLEDEIIPKAHTIFAEVIQDYSKSKKCITFVNGSKWFFKSANSNNSLRGRGLHSLVCEEAVFWQNGFSTYHETLRPQLADFKGWCLIISSPPSKRCPRGAEWFRRLENLYLDEIKSGNKEFAVFKSTIYDNPNIEQIEIENIKKTTDADTWQVEYLAEYNDKIGQVYWEFDPLTHKRGIDATEPVLARIRGMDFGIADNTACAWISLLTGNRIYVDNEYVANNLDVPSHAVQIKSKTQFQPQYTVLDSACWARDASLTSVAKRFAMEGIACTQGTKDLDGSVSDLKRLFAAGLIIVNPACKNLLQAIQEWQHGSHEPDILAATRYGIDALIRSGKLLPPIRLAKQDTRNCLEKFDAMAKAQERINSKLNRPQSGQAFKYI